MKTFKALSNRTNSASITQTRFRRGGAILETIIVMALLLSLSFGAVEYGYFFFVKNILSGAARDGVRAAIPASATNANVTTAVAAALTAAHIPTSAYTVTISPSDISQPSVTPGTPITVAVTCVWGTVGVTPLPVSMGGIASTKQVVGTAVMMREQ